MLTKNLITNFKPFIRCLPIMNLSYNTIKSITFIPEKKFSTDFESSSKQINIFKIIKSGENSIYDLPYGYDATNEFLEKEAEAGSTKEHFFTHSDIVQNVSSFLKELEIGKASSSRQSKFQDVKKSITLLHQEEIKNEFLKISTATEILEKNVNELRDSLADVLINIQSRNEGKYEENDLNKLTKNFLELGKYFLKNDLYSLEHNINIPSRISKDNLVKLAEAKKILEILNFSEIKDEQFLSMLPVFIMLNNLYVISENTMEELISEVSIRLFNPLGNSNLSQNNSEILKRYFVFLLLNSNFTKSTFDLDHLVIEKDTVLNFAKGGINDVLYILIDNIYKFAYANNETNATKPKTATLPKNVISFENFLRCYLKNVQVLIGKEDSVTKINYDLVENFLYSLLLLKESNYGNNILTSTVKDEIRHFINSGIFNLNLVKEVKVKNFLNPNDNLNRNLLKVDNDNISKKNLNDFCNRPNSLELLLEVENKIFSKLDEESDEFTFTFRESIFTAINSKNFLNQSNSDFKRYKDIIISSYFNYSEKKQK